MTFSTRKPGRTQKFGTPGPTEPEPCAARADVRAEIAASEGMAGASAGSARRESEKSVMGASGGAGVKRISLV